MAAISVIVPVYNVEAYLSRCVESILGQSFSDLELVLVDDGSPDRCGEICDMYARQDTRVHVIHRNNGGLSAARNSGIDWVMAHSESQWITFVDSDDWLERSFLLNLYTAVQETGCTLSACEYYITQGEIKQSENITHAQVMTADEYYCKDGIHAAAVACAKLYQKSLFQSIRYPLGKLHEDEFVTYRMVYAAEKVAYLSEALYAYYQNPEGIMLSKWNPRRLHILEATQQQLEYARETGNDMLLRKASLQYILSCHDHLQKASPEYKKELRRNLRYGLKLGRESGVFPLDFAHLWAYEEAYPMKPLWWAFFKGHAAFTRMLGKEKSDG